jgi:molybdopterin converting factor small subunit
MEIEVKGYASMGKYTSHLARQNRLDIPEGSTVGDLFRLLGVPEGLRKVVIVNGHHQTEAYVLASDDVVVFFPPLEGG